MSTEETVNKNVRKTFTEPYNYINYGMGYNNAEVIFCIYKPIFCMLLFLNRAIKLSCLSTACYILFSFT